MAKRKAPKTAFKKGNPGGPGRPKGSGRPTFQGIINRLKERNELEWQNDELGIILDDPYQQAMLQLVSAIQNGESWAIKDFMDRGIGKPAIPLEIEADVNIQPKFNCAEDEGVPEEEE